MPKEAVHLPVASLSAGELDSPAYRISHAPSAPLLRVPAASPLAGSLAEASPTALSQARVPCGHGRVSSAGGAAARRGRPNRTLPPNFFKGSLFNGFKAIPEIQSFECAAERIAPFTMPAEALEFEPPPEAVVTRFANGDQERKIHLNTRLSEHEQEMLARMREEANAAGEEFYPSVTAMATRFLSRARGDAKKAVKLMKLTQKWRSEYFQDGPLSDTSVLEDMRHGIVYFCGRDKALRPAIVVRAKRIPQQWYKEKRIDKFIRILIFCMEYFARYMVVPGRVENLNVIVDMQGLGISQVPVGALSEVYSVLSHHYIGRVYKFYACNVSYMLNTLAGIVKGLLTDRQKQKLNMIDDVKELRKDFALHQLEEDLGGSRPAATEFFPFPVLPGPFGAGDASGPAAGAVPDAHDVLSASGALGRSWDPKLSSQENRQLEYGPRAADILQECGMPVPPEACFDRRGSAASLAGRSLESFVGAPEAAGAADDADAAGCTGADAEAAEASGEFGAVTSSSAFSTNAGFGQEELSPNIGESLLDDAVVAGGADGGHATLLGLLSFRSCCAA